MSTNAVAECYTDPERNWVCAGDEAFTTGWLMPPEAMKLLVIDAIKGRDLVPVLEKNIKVAEAAVNDANDLAYRLKVRNTKISNENDDLRVDVRAAQEAFHFGDALVGVGVGATVVAVAAVLLVIFRPSL